MAQSHPTQENRLVYQLDERTQEIVVESSEWFTWLGIASMFTFRSATGTFTARKERAGNKRGGSYWKAYRKHEGKLASAYIGKSEALTSERLHMIAARLNGEDGLIKSRRYVPVRLEILLSLFFHLPPLCEFRTWNRYLVQYTFISLIFLLSLLHL